MATTANRPTEAPKANQYAGVARKRVFNLDTMEKETKEVPYGGEYTTDVSQLPHKYHDHAELLKIVQLGEKRLAFLKARGTIQGADASGIMKFIATMRSWPKFQKPEFQTGEKDENGNPIVDRKKQTAAIMAWLRTQPEMWNELVESARANAENDEDEDGSADEE